MFNWREIPLVRILLPFLAGIFLALEFNKAIFSFDFLLLFLLLPIVWMIKERWNHKFRWIYGSVINIFFLLLGYQLCFYHADWNLKNHFKTWIADENVLIGTVDNSPSFNSKFVKINLRTHQIGKENSELNNCKGTVLLSILNDSKSRELSYGDLLICKAKISAIQAPLNPMAFDYSQYLHLKNIDYQAFLADHEWQVLDSLQGNPLLNQAFKMRGAFLNILKNYLPGKNEFAVGSALILGYKEELDEEIKAAYANTGAMHVLAVSGLHVGMIWGIVAMLLGWVRWRHPAWKWMKTFLIIACLWAFALITGASPSVLRAATMFSFVLFGTSLGRSVNIYNTLAASAFCLLVINPFLIKEVGFQLSYFAVVGIVYFQPKVYRLWYIENKVGNFLWKLTAVAIAAQVTTFPLSLYYFHQFPLYFWLSGMIVIPFAFLILGGGVFLLLIHTLIPFLGKFFGMLLYGVIWLMNSLVFLIEQIPSGLLSGIWLSLNSVVLIYIFILFVSFSINSKKIVWLTRAMAFALILSGLFAFKGFENQLQKEIVFYHIPNKTFVDFVDGEHILSFGDLDIDSKTLGFASNEYRLSKGIKITNKYHFGYEDLHFNNWMQSNGFVQFYDKKIAFLKTLPFGEVNQKIALDYILVRKNAKFDLDDLIKRFDFKMIVLDGALEKTKRIEWNRVCVESNIPIHDINSKGALVINIESKQ